MKTRYKRFIVIISALAVALLVLTVCSCGTNNTDKLTVSYDDSHRVTEGDSLDSLKPYLTVIYTDKNGNAAPITEFALNGNLNEGECIVTVKYMNLTATFKVTVMRYSETQGLNYILNEDGDFYIVTGMGTATDAEVVIPSTHNDKPVQVLAAKAFENCDLLTGITLPSTIMRIESAAFNNCKNLTRVNYLGTIENWCNIVGLDNIMYYGANNRTLVVDGNEIAGEVVVPDNVTTIPAGAFYKCDKITAITIGSSIINIDLSAFYGCSKLENITIDEHNTVYVSQDGILYNKEKTDIVHVPEAIKGSVIIPDSVINIGKGAFEGCDKLESITIPFVGASINETENTHFGYIFGASSYNDNSQYVPSSLKTVVIADGESIESKAFYGCYNLEFITISDSVISIGKGAFEGCDKLESIALPFVGASRYETDDTHFGYIFGARYYGENFEYVPLSLKKVIIEDGDNIDTYAFYECVNLVNVTIADSITNIGKGAFEGCDKLESITIPFVGASINETENTHFGYIFGASKYYDYDDNDKIDYGNAYYVPSALRTVVITGGTSIGEHAFSNCYNLTSVTIPDSIIYIGAWAFYDFNAVTIFCKTAIKPDGWNSRWNYDCPVIWNCDYNDIDENGYAYAVIDGIRYALKDDEAIVVRQPSVTTEANIQQKIVYKQQEYSVTAIGERAFYNCSNLISIEIPDSVKIIYGYAFENCNDLGIINYLGTLEEWCNVESESLMCYGASDRKLFVDGNEITGDLVIPDTVTYIAFGAFRKTDITSVTIPDNIERICGSVFDECDNLQYNEYDNVLYLGNSSNPYLVLIAAKDKNITSCVIHNNAKVIADYAFINCKALIEVTVGNSVANIGYYAFERCTKIVYVNYLGTIESWCTIDGVYWLMYSSSSTTKSFCLNGIAVTNLVIPNTVTAIPAGAFARTNITNVSIPDSVTSVGGKAFADCSKLQYYEHDNAIYLGNPSNQYLILIEAKDKSISSCDIYEKTQVIAKSAFSGCRSISSVTIPDSVTNIDSSAFYGCVNLMNFSFNGTVAQWNAVIKGAIWRYNVPTTIVVCLDGEAII